MNLNDVPGFPVRVMGGEPHYVKLNGVEYLIGPPDNSNEFAGTFWPVSVLAQMTPRLVASFEGHDNHAKKAPVGWVKNVRWNERARALLGSFCPLLTPANEDLFPALRRAYEDNQFIALPGLSTRIYHTGQKRLNFDNRWYAVPQNAKLLTVDLVDLPGCGGAFLPPKVAESYRPKRTQSSINPKNGRTKRL